VELEDYAACDATELRRLIGAREISPGELREAAMRAIEAVDRELNAVVGSPYEDATAAEDAPFAGVPFAVKDPLPQGGRPLGFGSRMLDGFGAPRNATRADRFEAAGLVSLVRSATPEFAFNIDTVPVAHGPTRNPRNPEHGPGGSSGGSAALVASRAVRMAHANDAGGSIRIPAGWCGLVGLKPSRGRVPLGPAVGEAVGGFAHEVPVGAATGRRTVATQLSAARRCARCARATARAPDGRAQSGASSLLRSRTPRRTLAEAPQGACVRGP
jgi:amidase